MYFQKIEYIVQASFAIFHNISRSAELKDSFKQIKALSIAKKFTDAKSPEIKCLATMFISNVATNDDDVSFVASTSNI